MALRRILPWMLALFLAQAARAVAQDSPAEGQPPVSPTPPPAAAGDDQVRAPGEETLGSSKKEMQALAERFTNRLDTLRGELEETQRRLHALESAAISGRTGMQSRESYRFTLGGELEIEYVDTQNDSHPAGVIDEGRPHWQLDQLYLYPRVEFTKSGDRWLQGELLFTPETARLDEVAVVFDNVIGDSAVHFGLDDPFIAPGEAERVTESEILSETAFYRGDTLGARWSQDKRDFLWHLSLSNGLRLGQDFPTEDDSFPMLSRVRNTQVARSFEYGAGVGWRDYHPLTGDFSVLGFVLYNTLERSDITFLQNAFPGYNSSNRDYQMIGVNLSYHWEGLAARAQWVQAREGKIAREGGFLQASYHISLPGLFYKEHQFFTAMEPVTRLSLVRTDLVTSATNSLSWDRWQFVVGCTFKVLPHQLLKVEYDFNGEKARGGTVRNDELIVQIEIGF